MGMNQVHTEINNKVILENYNTTNEKCFPRCDFGSYYKKVKKEKPPWSIPISIFKDYKLDNEALLAKCLDMDW